MDDGIGAKLVGKPGIRRKIIVRRHQSRIVISRFRVDVVAARRLDQHRDIPGAEAGDRKPPAIEPARPEKWIALGGAPTLGYRRCTAAGKVAKKPE